jgi:hypothetical protein
MGWDILSLAWPSVTDGNAKAVIREPAFYHIHCSGNNRFGEL